MTAKVSEQVAVDSDVLFVAQDENGFFCGPLISPWASVETLEMKLKGQTTIATGILWLINTQTLHLYLDDWHYFQVLWDAEEARVEECVEVGNYNGEWNPKDD